MRIEHKVWVIMDKKHEIIAKGIPRNRYLDFADSTEGSTRILTYPTKNKAIAGFRDSWFYSSQEVDTYIYEVYRVTPREQANKVFAFMEAVEVKLILEI